MFSLCSKICSFSSLSSKGKGENCYFLMLLIVMVRSTAETRYTSMVTGRQQQSTRSEVIQQLVQEQPALKYLRLFYAPAAIKHPSLQRKSMRQTFTKRDDFDRMRKCYYLIIKRSDQIIVSILLSSNKLSVSQKLYYFYQLSLLKRVFGFKEIWDKQNMRVAVFFV